MGVLVGNKVLPLLTVVIDPNQNVVTATVTHFTKFTLFAVTTPGPSLLGPANNERLATMGTTLRWSSPLGATQYQLQVSPFNNDGPGLDLLIGDSQMVADAQFTLKAPELGAAEPQYFLLPDMTYHWQVRTTTAVAPKESDWSAWSVGLFRTPLTKSSTIDRVSPQANEVVANLTPTLAWSNSDRTVFLYEVQVSKDPLFGSNAFLYWEMVHGGFTTPTNSYAISSRFPLEEGTTYYWRVRPRVQGDGSLLVWTSTYIFVSPIPPRSDPAPGSN